MDKEHILQEIKRTSAANGGPPLGKARFFAETGNKTSDWQGVHWARWNDALREAGFAPNQLQTAFDKTELLEKYAKLAMEIGKLPAPADIQLKARSDPNFPCHKTFAKRLGAKAELVIQLAEHCKGKDAFEKVVNLCEQYLPRTTAISDDGDVTGEVVMGFVYLIKSGRFYKIGHTNSIGRRQYELAIQLPERAITVHAIRTDDPGGIEAYWHKRFEATRKNGEWFELDASDVAAFKRRKFM